MHRDLGLLFLRVSAGALMLFGHGLGKLQSVLAGNMQFADPIGIGAAPSLLLAVFAEFFCALAVILGVKTRWAAIPVAITMLVAAFIQHAPDPWRQKEFALIYGVAFITLILTDGGRYSLDRLWSKRR